MRRRIELSRSIVLEKYSDGSAGLIVEVGADDLAPVVLELELLMYALAERVRLSHQQGMSLVFEKAGSLNASEAEIVAGDVKCYMIPRDLETIIAFLLRYFRDGEAPVSHIDIDLDVDSQVVAGLTLVVRASDARPLLPGDEAKRILGIE